MSSQPDTIWPITPHTEAKHNILRAYFGAWLSIVGQKFPRVVFVDGFCGPGQYVGGEPGSPVVVIEEAKKALATRPVIRKDLRIELYFSDLDPKRIEHLNQRLAALGSLDGRIQLAAPSVGGFEERIQPILKDVEGRSGTTPFLVFIDPFGVKGYSAGTIQRILRLYGAEVFFLLDVDGIVRMIAAWSDENKKILLDASGLSEEDLLWIGSQKDRIGAFRVKYYGSLRQKRIAKGILPFRMYGPGKQPLHDMVFLTNNELGFLKMKEAMWQSAGTDFSFSEAEHPDQQPLQFDTAESHLWQRLMEQFAGQMVSGEKVRKFVELGTLYLNKHKTEALKRHEADGVAAHERISVSGRGKGPRGYPDGVTITFPPART
ncbi:MAG: three-Cys-motif partner protein TcmP [Elusimicrobia bacterium]|nr:three-Cys-motif partner protein TcmP [Elusimicrobiota bacterium]